MHGELGFELTDPLPGGDQLRVLRGGESRLYTAVDPVLASPVVDRLIADPGITRDVRDLATRLEPL